MLTKGLCSHFPFFSNQISIHDSLRRTLNPLEKMLYTWADPAGDRIILWSDGDKHVENDLRRDGVAPFQ